MTSEAPSATFEIPAAAKVMLFPDSLITVQTWPETAPGARMAPVTNAAALTRAQTAEPVTITELFTSACAEADTLPGPGTPVTTPDWPFTLIT
jgi:hypothetical protein